MSDKDKNPQFHAKHKDKARPESQAQSLEIKAEAAALALEHPDYAELEAKLNEAEEKLNAANSALEEHKNQLLRAHADLDNIRKRTEKDIANAHKYGLERLINELLPVIDSMERGLTLDVTENEFAARVNEGLQMTLKLFLDTLAKFGVKPVDPLNQPFNPELHQAISMQENPEAQPNTVLQVLQKGYLLNDRLIRPALVVVAKP
ncbi:MAG TPA: nucleotide exchange factor GrpE [Gammaproteobacteria bacterium]|nr:nucleotide exchange factor GrpE [Gammaproteobacteria bacterium]